MGTYSVMGQNRGVSQSVSWKTHPWIFLRNYSVLGPNRGLTWSVSLIYINFMVTIDELLKIVIAAAELAVAITLSLCVSIALNNHHVLWSMSILYFYVSFIYCFSSKGYAFRGFFCLSFK